LLSAAKKMGSEYINSPRLAPANIKKGSEYFISLAATLLL